MPGGCIFFQWFTFLRTNLHTMHISKHLELRNPSMCMVLDGISGWSNGRFMWIGESFFRKKDTIVVGVRKRTCFYCRSLPKTLLSTNKNDQESLLILTKRSSRMWLSLKEVNFFFFFFGLHRGTNFVRLKHLYWNERSTISRYVCAW